MDDAAPRPPGWYRDPDQPGEHRWWSGTDWETQTSRLGRSPGDTTVELPDEPAT